MPITVFDHFLDDVLIQQCIDYSIQQYNVQNFQLNNQRDWGSNIVEDSGPVHVHSIPTASDLYQRIFAAVRNQTGNSPTSIMCYYWMPNSHICWHNDTNHSGAVTIYLNRDWNPNHGGLFLYEQGSTIQAVLPIMNRAVMQIGGEMHAVTCTTSRAPIRCTLQMFF